MINLSGNDIAKDILNRINSEGFIANKKIALILATNDRASHSYAKSIVKKACEFNVTAEIIEFDDSITTESFIEHIKFFNDSDCSGIMIFSPLFKHLDFNEICSNVDYRKDVDCLNSLSNGKFYFENNNVSPATSKAVMSFIDFNRIDVCGKDVCIVGASNVVGFPVAKHFLNKNATVTVCNEFTKDLSKKTKKADIIVSCAGVAKLINENCVKRGQLIIDVGINFVDGKMCGDVDFENINDLCDVTKVPGGVGVVTSYMIFDNLNELVKKYEK